MSKFELESCHNSLSEKSCGEPAVSKMFDDAFVSPQSKRADTVLADATTAIVPAPKIITIAPGNGPFSGPVISDVPLTPAQAARLLAERFKL